MPDSGTLKAAAVAAILASGLPAAILVPRTAALAQDGAAPSGFTARGSLAVQTAISGAKLQVDGNIALEELGDLVRLDVLSVSLPGVDPALSSLASSQLLPPGGYTVVFDQAKHGYTVWSNAKRLYFRSNSPGEASQNPVIGAAATIGGASGLLHAFAMARPLKDYRAFSAALTMTGHGTTNGHPTTGLDFTLKRQERTGDPLDLHGSLQLADDLDEIPVRITASVQGIAAAAPPSTLRLDLTSVDRNTPGAGDFTVPAGFAKAAQATDVFGRVLP